MIKSNTVNSSPVRGDVYATPNKSIITIEKIAYKPLRGASPLAVLITAIGVSYLLQSTAQMIFGTAPKMVIVAELGNLELGSLNIPYYIIVTLVCSAIVMIALTLFILAIVNPS